MKKNWVARIIKFAIMGIIAIVVFGFVTMALWNWLMPALFGLRTITFWQALGLVILSKIFFGSFHSHGDRRTDWRHRMQKRWEKMTPEEREKFRQGMQSGWCPPEAAAEPKA